MDSNHATDGGMGDEHVDADSGAFSAPGSDVRFRPELAPRAGQAGQYSKDGRAQNSEGGRSPQGGDLERDSRDPRAILDSLPEEQRLAIVERALFAQSSWSALLPRPEDWNNYSPEDRQWWKQTINADGIDESKRQDRLVDAEVNQAKAGQALSFLVVVLALVGATIFGLRGNTVLALAFLGAPVLLYATNLLARTHSKSSRSGSTEEPKP